MAGNTGFCLTHSNSNPNKNSELVHKLVPRTT